MARKVYFHIGAPKTGTTYLQHVLAQNREPLREQGILYAAGEYPGDRVHATEFARGYKHSALRGEAAWRRIVRQVRGWDGDAVISHEFFGACTEVQARSVMADLAPAEVHLIFTARDYVRQATAAWQERLKYGNDAPLSEFTLDEQNGTPDWSWRTQDAAAVLGRWSVDLAPERVNVVTVPPTGAGAGLLWQRFASVLGVSPESCNTDVSFSNSSLGVVESELLRRFDERLPETFTDKRKAAAYVRDVLANDILAGRSNERLILSAGHVAELTQRSQEAAAAISAAGYAVVGDLGDIIPTAVQAGRAPENVEDSELLSAALDAMRGLLVNMESRDRRRKKQVAQARPRSLLAAARASDAPSVRLARRAVDRTRRLRANRREP
jgi:hypothetical protein